jgi:hypothetical protein
LAGVAKLIRRRRATDRDQRDPNLAAVFLLSPIPTQLKSEQRPRRVPMLDNGAEPVNGRLWFVGPAVVSGHYISAEVTPDDDLFRFVAEALGFGSTAAIVFDPRVPAAEIRFYPRGLLQADECEIVSIADDDVTLDHVYRVIERVYRYCLVTPDAQPKAGKLWADSRRWWPSSDAEAIVQMQLQIGMVAAFPTCTVRPEQSMPEGRDDLEIERSDPLDPSRITRLVLIELKVLRSLSQKGGEIAENGELKRVEEGVNQAYAYGNSKGFRQSSVCCFDMRKDDTGERCFDHVRQLASTLTIDLKRWFIYASSQLYRGAMVAGRSPSLGSP